MENEKELQFSLKELRARHNKTQENVAVSKVQVVANYFGVKLGQIFLG